MNTHVLALILPLSALAAPAPALAGEKIVAGPVQVSSRGLSGTFHAEGPASAGGGTGGACLVYSAQAGGGARCRSDGDCAPDPPFAGGSGYCVRAGNARAGRCWLRPAETPATPYCYRSKLAPLPVATRIDFPMDAGGNPLPVAAPRPGWWRVHACLNLKPGACADPASAYKLTANGPPGKVR